MIVGITGTNGAGKETVSRKLQEYGFAPYSCSDAIRDEAKERRCPFDRDALITLGNELRASFGPSVLAKRVYGKIMADGVKDAVVVSIRNPAEAQYLKSRDGFVLVWVDADSRLRYERGLQRKRDKADVLTFDQFVALESREKDAGPTGQRLALMEGMADIRIENNGTVRQLEETVSGLVETFRRSEGTIGRRHGDQSGHA